MLSVPFPDDSIVGIDDAGAQFRPIAREIEAARTVDAPAASINFASDVLLFIFRQFLWPLVSSRRSLCTHGQVPPLECSYSF